MATPALSGTYVFNPSAYYIILRALRQCQAIAEGEIPSNQVIQDAGFALNSMIKAWQGSGIHVWCEQDITLFLEPDQTSYQIGLGTPDFFTLTPSWSQLTLAFDAVPTQQTFIFQALPANLAVGNQFGMQLNTGNIWWSTVSIITTASNEVTTSTPLPTPPVNVFGGATAGQLAFTYPTIGLPRPLRMPAGRRYIYEGATGGVGNGISNEIPLVPMSRLDYAAQPNKSSTGAVTQFFYDPQYDPTGTLYCWPTPQDDSAALKFTTQRPLQDIDVLTNLVDFPKEWINTLTWNLAAELGPEFDVSPDRYEIITTRAQASATMAMTWDRETGSVLFGVANDPQYRTG